MPSLLFLVYVLLFPWPGLLPLTPALSRSSSLQASAQRATAVAHAAEQAEHQAIAAEHAEEVRAHSAEAQVCVHTRCFVCG